MISGNSCDFIQKTGRDCLGLKSYYSTMYMLGLDFEVQIQDPTV